VIVIATLLIYNRPKNLQGMTNNVRLTFSVGGTIPQFKISVRQGKARQESVALIIILSAVSQNRYGSLTLIR
jgi:hypothetical protein